MELLLALWFAKHKEKRDGGTKEMNSSLHNIIKSNVNFVKTK